MKVGLFSRPIACNGAFFLPEKPAESTNLSVTTVKATMLPGNTAEAKLKIS
jgi:hypothetical protein